MKKTLKWLLTIGVLLAFVGVLIGGADYGELGLLNRDTTSASVDVDTTSTADNADTAGATEEETTTTSTATTDAWYHIYNTECLANGTTEDDFNFGLRPEIEKMSTQQLYELWREVLWNDPCIGSANLAWFDRKFSTNYLGEFYETCKGDWAKTINLAKERFMADEELYHRTLTAFFQYLESAVYKVSVVQYSGIRDQFYLNPFTTSGTPDIVVFETVQQSGYFLRMDLKIKGSSTGGNPADGKSGDKVETLAFMVRIDCLFQPCNVAELLNIAPQANPVKTPATKTTTPSKTTPSKTTPSKTTPSKTDPVKPVTPVKPVKPVTPVKPVKPVTPVKPVKPVKPVEPVKPVTPSYNKDPSKGTQTGDLTNKNDNTGTGGSTSTGKGSKTSSAEQPTNTGQSGQSYSDYKAEQKQMEEINKPQKTGKDDNTPSYTPPATTTTVTDSSGKTTTTTTKPAIDNNGSSGNGNGGANDASPKNSPGVTYNGGTSIPNGSNSGGATEAPPD